MSESKEIATQEPDSRAVTVSSPLGSVADMLNVMMSLAKDPSVDAGKFETIARIANEQQDRAQKQQFYEDKAAAMFEMPSIRKDSKIIIPGKNGAPDRVQGTFAKWPDMQRAIYPVLDRHNLRLSHDVDHEGVNVLVTPILQHRNGYVERGGQMALPLDTSGGKNNTQGAGSAQSYGMRYSTVAMLGIRYEAADDDGNLIALPDEPLNDQQQRRVLEGQAAIDQGLEAYEHWFMSIPAIDRAWLIQTGRHSEWTGNAPLPTRSETPATSNGAKSQPKQQTAAEWANQYEADCEACQTLDDLARIQQRGANAIAKLRSGGHTDLHDQAIKAGADAYARLSNSNDESDI